MTPDLGDLTREEPMWFVCSYPKSGNTWVRALLYHYAARTGLSHHLTRASDLDGATYEIVSPKPVSQLTPVQLVQLRGAALMYLRRMNEGPLAVKSHYLNGTIAGLPMFSPAFCDKVIHVVRDPREVAPSLADHTGSTVDEAIDMMAQPDFQLMGPARMSHYLHTWSVHTETWLDAENVDTMTVTYAGLHRDTAGELERILEHLEVEIDPEAVEFAVKESRFEKMRRIEKEDGFDEASAEQERFFRRGKAGAWSDELTGEQAARIEREHADTLAQLREIGGVAEQPMGAGT